MDSKYGVKWYNIKEGILTYALESMFAVQITKWKGRKLHSERECILHNGHIVRLL